MRVFVDLDRCEGHGMCVLAAPEAFDLDDEGLLDYDSAPPEELRAAVQDAARTCPVAAITLDAAPPPDPGPAGIGVPAQAPASAPEGRR